MCKQNPIRRDLASKIRDFSDRLLEGGILAISGLHITRSNDVRGRAQSGGGRALRASRRLAAVRQGGWRSLERRSPIADPSERLKGPAFGRPGPMAGFARATLKKTAALLI